jgi:transposase
VVIEEAVKLTPPKMRAVIEALQALRGVAQITAVTIVAEVGEVWRFPPVRSGAVVLVG